MQVGVIMHDIPPIFDSLPKVAVFFNELWSILSFCRRVLCGIES